MLVNATCFSRSALLVVEPHSRSMVPLASSGMRFDEVTGSWRAATDHGARFVRCGPAEVDGSMDHQDQHPDRRKPLITTFAEAIVAGGATMATNGKFVAYII